MRINTNVSALNIQRNMTASQTGMTKSLERLSSGLRITKAADDAAGLGISEKMRGQIRGLKQAQKNAEEAISLIQTAEGAMGETQNILQRMRELAVQSSSDTATNKDRQEIQKEMDHLAKEITRVSNNTEFNTKNLLSGAFGGGGTAAQKFQIGANEGQYISIAIEAMDAETLGVAGASTFVSSVTANGTGVAADNISEIGTGLTSSAYDLPVDATAASAGAVTQSDTGAGAGTVSGTYTGARDKTFLVKATAVGTAGTGDVSAAQYSVDGGLTWNNATVTDAAGSATITLSDGLSIAIADAADQNLNDTWTFAASAAKVNLTLQTTGGTAIGSTQTIYKDMTSVTVGDSTTDQTLTLSGYTFSSLADGTDAAAITLGTVSSTAATVAGNGVVTTLADTKKGLNVGTQSAAMSAITVVDDAIKTVSSSRSNLGAIQNRLEHTISNLGVTEENMTAAESRIRDVDMAKEMSEFTRNQILQQASTAMLAQANQVPQSVLKLLG